MIKNKDIIIVGLQPWDIEVGSNCKNIALEFSKFNRVLYVNAPLDQNTIYKERAKPRIKKRLQIMRSDAQVFSVAPNLWNLYPKSILYSINWIPFTSVFTKLNWLNNYRFASSIKEAIYLLKFEKFILFNDSDMFRSYYLKELLKPDISIYYSRDNLMSIEYWKKHGKILEPKLMLKSDLVTANSPYLTRIAKKYNKNSFYVGQGCDLAMFDPSLKRELPEALKEFKRPIIGYIGAILSKRLDLELLLQVCQRAKQWSFVFIGKADEQFVESGIFNLENVYFLGLKREDELPFYLSGFDVAINPQLVNELTVGNYPRKIDEYLAMGKPVVATATETMEIFKDVTYLGKTADDYIELISRAISENCEALISRRIEFAKSHTWENSVIQISRAIKEVKPELFERR